MVSLVVERKAGHEPERQKKMKVVTREELVSIISKHSKFVNGVAGGVKADLHGVDLSDADLRCANLHGANLHGANLHGADLYDAHLYDADLYDANLQDADLTGANLTGADLTCADLQGAILHGADLHGADLCDANLYDANLQDADLTGADLRCADLHGADLCDANLYDANLRHADLTGANLTGADLTYADISSAILDDKEQSRKGIILNEEMIGYKKLADGSICVLSIPKGAMVFSINGYKCRTNKAKVIEGGGVSIYDRGFVYEKGKEYVISDFCLAYNVECAPGIHFFKTRKETMNHDD